MLESSKSFILVFFLIPLVKFFHNGRKCPGLKQEIKDTLKIREIEKGWNLEARKPLGYKHGTVEHLKGAIVREDDYGET